MPEIRVTPFSHRLIGKIGSLFQRRAEEAKLTREWVESEGFSAVCAGRGTYGNPAIIGAGRASLTIGNFTSISAGVTIVLANHESESVSTYPFSGVDWRKKQFRPLPDNDPHAISKGPVTIGNDVWLGHSSIILPGVTVGDGAIVGAGAVVSKDVPPYGIAVGNPASVVKFRHSREHIAAFLQIKWWDWDDEFLEEAERDFFLSPTRFIAKYRRAD